MLSLWTESYRPRTLDEYVWRDPETRKIVENWLAQGALPHCLFSGTQGTGKTSLALLCLRVLDIPEEDILRINASRERKIDDLQDKIVNFIGAWALNPSGLKYILLDEADKLSQYAQGMLRMELENYANSCRFLMTCNYPNKIIPALHSRLQELKFGTLDETDFIMRAADILMREEVGFEPEILLLYKECTYPDLRKCIGMLQQNSRDARLQPPPEESRETTDYLLSAIALFKNHQYIEGRKLIVEHADPEEYEELYRTLYQNLHLFGNTQTQQDEALLAIRKGVVYDTQVADRQINLAATILELCQIAETTV